MFKNISTIKLIGILAVLAAIYFAFQLFGGSTRSKSFKENLVEIDTAKVTRMLVMKAGQNLELKKDGDQWKVSLAAGKYANAEAKSVKSSLENLLRVKPSRVVAKKADKWSEYQVDSAGTRVQVFEGDEKTLDLVVGRFGFNQQAMQQQQQMMMGGRGGMQQFYSYVRLQDEDEVYVADNFMGMSLGTNAADFRNSQVLKVTKDSLRQISFQYPDSAFTLDKVDSMWVVGNALADSAATASFLNGLSHVNNRSFVDDIEPAAMTTATLSMTVKESGKPDVVIKAFPHPVHKWVINSSVNPDSYFSEQSLFDKLFVSRQKLLGA